MHRLVDDDNADDDDVAVDGAGKDSSGAAAMMGETRMVGPGEVG